MIDIDGLATFRARRKTLEVDAWPAISCLASGENDHVPLLMWTFSVQSGREVPRSSRRNYPLAVVTFNEDEYRDTWGIDDRGAWTIACGLFQRYPGLFEARVERSAAFPEFSMYRTDFGELAAVGDWGSSAEEAADIFGLGDVPQDLRIPSWMPPAWQEYLERECEPCC
jgi:hypothetical protein